MDAVLLALFRLVLTTTPHAFRTAYASSLLRDFDDGLHARANASARALYAASATVDLIATTTGAGGQRTTSLLLQNVLVLAVGSNTGDEAPGPRGPRAADQRREQVLTLSLKVENAQLLALSLDKGAVSVAVRNPDDVRLIEAAADVGQSAVDAPSRLPVTSVTSSLRREAKAVARSAEMERDPRYRGRRLRRGRSLPRRPARRAREGA